MDHGWWTLRLSAAATGILRVLEPDSEGGGLIMSHQLRVSRNTRERCPPRESPTLMACHADARAAAALLGTVQSAFKFTAVACAIKVSSWPDLKSLSTSPVQSRWALCVGIAAFDFCVNPS